MSNITLCLNLAFICKVYIIHLNYFIFKLQWNEGKYLLGSSDILSLLLQLSYKYHLHFTEEETDQNI